MSSFTRDEADNPRYSSEVGEQQLTFIRNDLAFVPKDQLVVISFHIPLTEMRDVKKLMNLLGDRPHTLSLSAHTHFQRMTSLGRITVGMATIHIIITIMQPHQALGGRAHLMKSVFRTQRCEMVHPTAMASSHSVETNIQFGLKAARRPADYQMNIWAPWEVASTESGNTDVIVNVFGGTKRSTVEIRLGEAGEWRPMTYLPQEDPYYKALKARDDTNQLERKLHSCPSRNNEVTELKEDSELPQRGQGISGIVKSTHIWQAKLPADAPKGTHVIYVRTTDMFGQTFTGRRIIRVH